MTPENIIKNQICYYLKSRGIFFWSQNNVGIYDPVRKRFRKSHNPFRIKGVSDILGVLPCGRLLCIEVKTKRGYPTPEQKLFIENVNLNGGLAFIARNIDDVIRGLL